MSALIPRLRGNRLSIGLAVGLLGALIVFWGSRDVTVPRMAEADFGFEPAASEAMDFFGAVNVAQGKVTPGGYSALLVSESGDALLTVSDLGQWLRLYPLYKDNHLVGLDIAQSAPLLDPEGKELADTLRDAEGLAIAEDGGILVAFETLHRLWRYAAGDPPRAGRPTVVATPDAMSELAENAGPEAATSLCDGRILLISQRKSATGGASAWLGRAGAWRPFAYQYDELWQPSGAVTLPDCRVVVLERKMSKKQDKVYSARLVVLPHETLADVGQDWSARELLRRSAPKGYGRFEGIAARPAGDKGTWLYLISDNDARDDRHTVLLLLRFNVAAWDLTKE